MKLPYIVLVITLTLLLSVAGCWQKSINSELYQPYKQTQLNTTSSAEVLSMLQTPEAEKRKELLSQTDTIVVSWGQDKSGYRQWLNLVAFDEQNAVAKRKYFFWVDEKSRRWLFMHPKWSSVFDANVVVDPEVINKPYANSNDRSIAILQFVLKAFQDDIRKVAQDNKMLGICRDTVNESYNAALNNLAESPAIAANLSTEKGLEYLDRAFYSDRIKLTEAEGIAHVRLQAGAVADRIRILKPDPNAIDYNPNSGVIHKTGEGLEKLKEF